jgi:hypothetical protein
MNDDRILVSSQASHIRPLSALPRREAFNVHRWPESLVAVRVVPNHTRIAGF